MTIVPTFENFRTHKMTVMLSFEKVLTMLNDYRADFWQDLYIIYIKKQKQRIFGTMRLLPNFTATDKILKKYTTTTTHTTTNMHTTTTTTLTTTSTRTTNTQVYYY